MNDFCFKKGIKMLDPSYSGPYVDPAWESVKKDFPTVVKIVKAIKNIFAR